MWIFSKRHFRVAGEDGDIFRFHVKTDTYGRGFTSLFPSWELDRVLLERDSLARATRRKLLSLSGTRAFFEIGSF